MAKPLFTLLLSGLLGLSAQASIAGSINVACLKSGRPAANPSLCKCIEAAAQDTLSFTQRNTAANLILSPHKAERMRTSSSRSQNKFWADYMKFAQAAERQCK